jgi:hypothetical protein
MVVPTFYTHGSVIMELDDDMKYIFVDHPFVAISLTMLISE